MKHRSVSKVRSNKTSQKNRFVANQMANRVNPILKKIDGYVVWCSKEIINTNDAGIKIPAYIRFVGGTYSRAKHDIVNSDGTVTRYANKVRYK